MRLFGFVLHLGKNPQSFQEEVKTKQKEKSASLFASQKMISTKNPWISANETAEGEAHHLSFTVALWMEFKGNNIDSSAVALLYDFETDAIIK